MPSLPEPIHQLDLPKPGSIIAGHYEIIERLGEGGMGSVFKAKDLTLNREVAIKFLLPHRLEKSVNILRFQREAQATARLNHPGIVRMHRVETSEDGQPFLVMDFISGKTLAQRIASKGQLPLDEVLDLFIAVCDALAHAHGMGVLHRDLKPSNIIICSSGPEKVNVKVLDFGLAKIIASASTQDLTQTGQTFGTPSYMSPEMALGNAVVDHRSDIYSLGCTLYEALTASPPYVAGSAYATALKHETEEALTLSEAAFGRDFPQQLELLVTKMIAKRPEQRYQSMDEVKEALLSVKRNLNSQQQAPRVTFEDRPVKSRMLVVGIILGGVVAIITSGMLLWIWLMPQKTAKVETPQSIRQEFLDENLKSANDLISMGDKCMARGSIYPSMMAYGAALTALGVGLDRANITIADVMCKKALALSLLGRLAESESLYRKALSMIESAAPNTEQHYHTMLGLGTVLVKEKKFGEAKQMMGTACELFKAKFGTDSLQAGYSLSILATCFTENHEYEKAESILQDVSAIYRKYLGSHSEWYASAQSDLAQNYYQMGNFAKAETAWNQAITAYKASGKHAMELGAAYVGLAQVYKAKGDLLSALHSLEQGLPLLSATSARGSDKVFDGMFTSVDIMIKLRRYADADRLCQTMAECFSQQLKDKPKQLATRLIALAKRQRLLGRTREAQAELKQASELLEQAKSGDQIDGVGTTSIKTR